ncbi:ABC transporter substrate-binding protein [Ensifer canadensis]
MPYLALRPAVRLLLALIITILLFATVARAEGKWPMTVKDAAGREVTIPAAPKAILLGSGFNLVALSLIHPKPVSLLAGWSGDMKGDLAILANWQADTEPGQRAIDYLTSTGVPVIVVDFNSDPLKSTADMMRLLGRVLERDDQAEAFARFYEDKLALIRSRVAAKPEPRPTVLMDAFPKPDRCCWAYGVGGLGEFLTIAGGRNIAEGTLPRPGGTVSAEAVIAANPDVYIATSSPGGVYSGFSIGPGVARDEAEQTLAAAVKVPVLSGIVAVESGRVHGIWNFFNAIPLNIVAAEAFAHWLRPDIFADLDPEKSLAEINERFAAVPFEGTYTVSLGADTPR